jgi:hypothetical protein
MCYKAVAVSHLQQQQQAADGAARHFRRHRHALMVRQLSNNLATGRGGSSSSSRVRQLADVEVVNQQTPVSAKTMTARTNNN